MPDAGARGSLTIIAFPEPKTRVWVDGPIGYLQRIRDIIDRGKLDIGQLRLSAIVGWLLGRSRERSAPLGELCGMLESAARLLVVKSRRLDGYSEDVLAEEIEPWAGPPPELPLRRSWLGDRLSRGPLSFAGPVRLYAETETPSLELVSAQELRAAMLAALGRARRPIPILTPRVIRVSVERTSAVIMETLAERGELFLHELPSDSRDAQVAAFLACLTLARQGRVALAQEELFGTITIFPAAALEEALA